MPNGKELLRTGNDARRSLLNQEVVTQEFSSVVFADSHGAYGRSLGAGILYYSLVHMLQAQVAVCIGSGGGFVPALIRRSQIDLDLAPSATYLVDANLPDLGFGSPIQSGGWMTEDNPFSERERDICILPVLSVDAAKLFGKQGVKIDYLHIDGDHSKDGVLGDFRAYAPLLTPWAVVTAHDLSLPGIQSAMSRITEEFPDWEILGFPDIGVGTAVLRRRVADLNALKRAKQESVILGTRNVELKFDGNENAIEKSQRRARYERWNYLKTTAYQTRYRVVLGSIDQPDVSLVELGGYPNTIVDFITEATTVRSIEPYTTEEFESRVDDLSRSKGIHLFRHDVALSDCQLEPESLGRYNLVALGFDPSDDTAERYEKGLWKFITFVLAAQKVAIEVPRYKPSMIAWSALEKLVVGRVLLDVALDLRQDPAGDEYFVKDDRALRRVIVFEPKVLSELGEVDRAVISAAAAEAFDAANHKYKGDKGPELYSIGTPINFWKGGNSELYVRSGWVPEESRFRWTLGDSSVLLMHIDKSERVGSKSYEIVFDVEPFVVPGRLDAQRFAVELNGYEIGRTVLNPGRQKVRFEVPDQILSSSEAVQVVIAHPDARRPCDLIVGSNDLKTLSVRFYEVILRPFAESKVLST